MLKLDRRSSKRFNIRLKMLVFVPDSKIVLSAETRDVSIDGFFCVVDEPFTIGQKLRCLLLLTQPSSSGDDERAMCLECQAEVLRISADQSHSSFGLGCAIHEFRVIPEPIWAKSFSGASGFHPAVAMREASTSAVSFFGIWDCV
jgi:PilZ domain-containing protein